MVALADLIRAPLAQRITTETARRCDECGSTASYVLHDRLGCRECDPTAADDPEAAWYDATPSGGRLRYVAVDRGQIDPPASAATGRLYVSPTLDWFVADLPRDPAREPRDIDRGLVHYRQLDRPYFDWLAGQLHRATENRLMSPSEGVDAWAELGEIADAAVELRILGGWVRDLSLWPTSPSRSYSPPQKSAAIPWGNAGRALRRGVPFVRAGVSKNRESGLETDDGPDTLSVD